MAKELPPAPVPCSPSPTWRLSALHWRRLWYDYGPPLLLMVLIFCASTDVGSSAHSGQLISAVLGWLGLARWVSPEQVEAINHFIRKTSHVTEYALLAALLHRAVARGRDRWPARLVLEVMAVAAFYAATDEFHQRFVPSRGASVWDVLLDTCGAALGLALKWLGEKGWRPRSFR